MSRPALTGMNDGTKTEVEAEEQSHAVKTVWVRYTVCV